MRSNIHKGVWIQPESVRRITKFICKVSYNGYPTRYLLVDKLTDRMKALMV